jgi:hypothetical protein
MNELNSLYAQLLHFGLILIREAIRSHEYEWAEAEADFLHNIPSLFDEPNVHRHQYFWLQERDLYLARLNRLQNEQANSRLRTYYQPIWQEMEPLLLEWFAKSGL